MIGYTDEVTADKFGAEGETVKVRYPIFKVEAILSPEQTEKLKKLQSDLAAATSAAKKAPIQAQIDALLKG